MRAAAALVLAAAALFVPSFAEPGQPLDEGTLILYPARLLAGDIPNRDYATLYGPGNVWLLAVPFAIAGPTLEVERATGLLVRIALVLGIVALVRPHGRLVALAAGLVALLLVRPLGLAAYPWLSAVALALASRAMFARSAIGSGVLAGLAGVFRPDIFPATILGGSPGLLLRPGERRRYALGVALGLLPLAAHVILATPAAVLENAGDVLWNAPARRLPLPPAAAAATSLLVLIAASLAVTSIAGLRRWRSGRDASLLGAALFGVGILPQAVQRADLTHLLFVATPVVPFLLPALADLAGALRSTLRGVGAAGALAAIILAAPQVVLYAPPTGHPVEHRARTFRVESAERATQVRAVLDAAERLASPGARLFVGPADLTRTNYADSYLYVLLPHLEPATYYLEMIPRTTNRPGSRYASDLASADVAILSTLYDGWDEPNASMERGTDAPLRVLAERFELRATIGPFRVYARR